MSHASPTILYAEDDHDDRVLVRDAFAAARLRHDIQFVDDGIEVFDYLYRRGRWAKPAEAPRPDIILVDLNMPRMDGRETIAALKADRHLRHIPVVVLTTSGDESDVIWSYAHGASSYVIKPVAFESLVAVVRDLAHYWFETVRLP